MISSRLGKFGLGIVALAAAAIIPVFLNSTFQFTAALAVIFGFAILSLVVLTGYVGQISLCQATFVGISAYMVSMLTVQYKVAFPLAVICGVLLSFTLGVLVGLPALRLRGILLAIVTVGVALVFDGYFFQDQNYAWFTGGLNGWTVPPITVLGYTMDSFHNVLHAYWVLLALFGLVAVLVVNLHDSGSGRRFRAIRDSEVAAATMGVSLTRYKLLAFGLSAAIAGLGGAFVPAALGSVSSSIFSLFYSLPFAAFAVLMGVRFVPAAALGGIFMAFVPAILGQLFPGIRYDWFNLGLGALLVVQLIIAPDGVWGNLARDFGRVGHLVGARPKAAPKVAA
ncbi:MAG TPA: branched-chain amino acid ABC transporter permease [Candidatus Dormibacteraeota bacterium]